MEQMRIMIALPDNHAYFNKEFVASLINVQTSFYRWKAENKSPHELSIVCQGSVCLDEARNSLVRLALKNDITHIFFMDTDQTFLPETVQLMIECFEGNPTVDAVTGLYTWKKAPFMPHIYGGEEKGKFLGASQFPLSELFEVRAAGTGILMIDVEFFKKKKGPWFKFKFNKDGSYKIGEDMYFFKTFKPLTICDPRNRSEHWRYESYGLDDYIDSNGIRRVVDDNGYENFEVPKEAMEKIVKMHQDNTKHQG